MAAPRHVTPDWLSGPARAGWRLRAALARTPSLAPLEGPFGIGRAEEGARLAAGTFLWRGRRVEAPEAAPWDVPIPDPARARAIHGFDWLDDLAAAASPEADARARDWADAWQARFGSGRGPGWAPVTVGRRLARWADHAGLLMAGEAPRARRLRRAALAQAGWLARRWPRAAPGADRLDALAGLVLARLALGRRLPGPHLDALGRAAARAIDAGGTVPSRAPEDLARAAALLARLEAALASARQAVPPALSDRLAAARPVLRALRHADGRLARFHGGGGGVPGALDRTLAGLTRAAAPPDRAMGYARLAHGRTTVVADLAPPPEGAGAHASSLAFELTSGRRPLVVSCGAGHAFGGRWRRAGRATPSHSTLVLDGRSSARLDGPGGGGPLLGGPEEIRAERRVSADASGIVAGHGAWVASHGLTHIRRLALSRDGRRLRGEDTLATVEAEDEAALDAALDAGGGRIGFSIRFHLHPAVAARLDAGARAATLTLASGEVWRLTHAGGARMTLEAGVHLAAGAPAPVPARQVVLSGRVVDYATRVTWTLAKAPETPDAVRDLVHEDRPVLV